MAAAGGAPRGGTAAFAILAARSFLHLVVFGGLFVFMLWIYIWIDPRFESFVGGWDETHNIAYKAGPAAGTVSIYGYSLIIVVYQWVAILAAVFAVILLGVLPRTSAYGPRSWLRQLRLRARAVAKWEAPGHSWWVSWCGGMSGADIFVVVVYLLVHAFWFARLTQGVEQRLNALDEMGLPLPYSRSLARLESAALNFGVLLWPSLLMLFFPMPHVSFLSDWLGTHYADMIRWHRWIGHATMWVLSAHAVLYYIFWGANREFWHQFSDWGTITGINNLAGTIGWGFALALWATSISWVRRNFFEVFYRFHIACFLGFVTLATVHYYYSWSYWLPGLIVYGLDVALRAGQAANATTVKGTVSQDGTFTTLEIKLARGFRVRPAEEMFILIPQLSNWQWHPFTVYELLDNPDRTKTAVFHAKVFNQWTTELQRRVQMGQTLAARVAGPLGRSRDQGLWRDYSTVVLVGGGVGALPILATLKDIINTAVRGATDVGAPSKPPAGLRKVVLSWVSRHGSDFGLLDTATLEAIRECDWIEARFYITTPLNEAPSKGLEEYVPKPATDPKWLPLTHHWASPYRLRSDRPAQARLGGPLLEFLTASLVFIAAFFGLVLGYAYEAEIEFSGQSADNTHYWKSGLVILACLTVMILGLPYALVVLPVTVFTALRDRRDRLASAPTSEGSTSDDGKDAKVQHLPVETFLAQAGGVTYGRPDVFALVAAAAAAEPGHVGVFAGGPSSLRATANNAAYAVRQKGNLFGRLVHYFDESFEL